ncbi:UDP-N-acetylmuramoyl-L-alanine--D-glutamate ligase [Labilibaculum euxinus]|uniref:UDP-N-acetylmuramoylalanine--D-glutamate ligase n=1 Tax=Labilibaculum euxinus TaxID=2686357 RepID=A0A7M4DA84_9BACT|nr:UDP-N-acetylmuramoyl-L-alanine--D-glutamate ligase [Labilibaculum euxinus]MUP39563.1 UDP-N-acetylmuramoyl-L-alanine--D-glutamate ligase [Labilibaculum euxinus]MVB08768.1 UDP-N-acetylmuramoyl-L-alanine--D-glutamate ligase [Labilibaculum euxinus]
MAKRIVILGAGESGVGAAVLAKSKGFDVFVSDLGEISPKYRLALNKYQLDFEEKQHTESLILSADEVVKSPGIPDTAPLIVKLKEKNIPVISEIEFAGRFSNAKMICITGSNGKTTTTLLLYHMLKKAGLHVGLAGNVGDSLAWQVAEKDYTHYVVELSSFQLDGMYDFRANIAILLNITPDHLDRYDYKMENYINSKFRILQNMKSEDSFVFCTDDDIIKKELMNCDTLAQLLPFSVQEIEEMCGWIENELLKIQYNENLFSMDKKDLSLPGIHNVYNSLASGIAGSVLQIRKEVIRESLSDFQGVDHRLEKVVRVRGIQFINDSKATNINSTWYALESMDEPVVWIVGGVDKGNDYSVLADLVKEKVKGIVCLGVDNSKIHAAFDGKVDFIVDAGSMKEAVNQAYQIASKEEIVLLSPACASFDLFKNYEDRGNQFKEEVRNL